MSKKGLIFTLMLILCGCAAIKNPSTIENRANSSIKEKPSKAYGNITALTPAEEQSEEIKEFETVNKSTSERAKFIAHSVAELNGIEKASVVVTGDSAIVGIEVSGNLGDVKLIRLKNDVEQEVKRVDSSIEHVAVTAAADLVQRITNMADSVSTNEGVPRYNNRMQEIIQKLTPPL